LSLDKKGQHRAVPTTVIVSLIKTPTHKTIYDLTVKNPTEAVKKKKLSTHTYYGIPSKNISVKNIE